MSRLDNQDIYEQRDPSRMRERLRGLGRQCRDASQQVGGLKLPDAYSKVCALVLAGVGGSGIGGDLLADLGAAKGARLPIFTWRKGEGLEEVGVDAATGRELVGIDPWYFRPTDIDILVGDYSKAREALNWEPRVRFHELVRNMIEADIAALKAEPKKTRSPQRLGRR